MSKEFDIAVQVFASDEATHVAARQVVEGLFGVTSPPERTGWQEDSTFCCELSTRLGDVRSIRGLTRGVSEMVPDAYVLTRWGMDTHWHCYDRKTGILHVIAQGDAEIPDTWSRQ